MVNENSRMLVIKSLRRINMKINIKCLAWYLVHHIPPINGNSTTVIVIAVVTYQIQMHLHFG